MFRSDEQRHFNQVLTRHMQSGTHPLLLEGGVGLGKTRAYLHALAASGKQVAIILPTHQLIDQLLASADLAETGAVADTFAFRPAAWFGTQEAYLAHKEKARNTRILLCTAASLVIDQQLAGGYTGVIHRDYLLFDEADQLPDLVALQTDLTIPAAEWKAAGVSGSARTIAAALCDARRGTLAPETRAAARAILAALIEEPGYARVGLTDSGDLVLKHKLPGRLLRKISNRANVAFISATLSIQRQFKDFQHALGLGAIDPLSMAIEPKQHGTINFTRYDLPINTPEWLDSIIDEARTAPKPVLIVTPSHTLAEQIGAALGNAVVRAADETANQAASRITPDGILIAAGAWAGLDTPLRWRSILIPTIPFPAPESIEGAPASSYITSRNTAIRRMHQAVGRGIRTADAQCTVIVFDARVAQLGAFLPDRFLAQWPSGETKKEGARHCVAREVAQRSPAVRKWALRHYGEKCMALRCKGRRYSAIQLDVHHRNPIKDGERDTRIEDLMVLCCNCHRLAHTEDPPMPLDQIYGPPD